MDWWVWTILALAILMTFLTMGFGTYLYATRDKKSTEEVFDSSALLKTRTNEYGTVPAAKKSEYDTVPPYQYGQIPQRSDIYAGFPEEGYGNLPTENEYEATSSVID